LAILDERLQDEVNIVANENTMDITNNSNDFLTGEYLAKGLLTYAAAGALPRIVRESGIPNQIFREAKYANNIIKGFYDKGMKPFDKLMLQWHHFGFGDPEQASQFKDAQAFINKYNDEIKFLQTGEGRHSSGHAIGAMEELDTMLGKKEGWKKVGRYVPLKGTNRFHRVYDRKLEPTNHRLLKRLQQAIKSDKVRYSTLGHLNHEIKLAHQQDMTDWGGGHYAQSSTRHDIRSEIAKTELVEHVTDGNANYHKLKHEGGISKPVKMNAGHFFQHHSNMWPDLKSHDNITVSKIIHQGDHTKQIGAAKRSPLYRIARHVYSRVDDLNDRKAVMKAAMDRAGTMGTSRFKDYYEKLHPNAEGPKEAVEDFMRRYQVTPDGKLVINFSPDYKPHKLLGGVNANIILSHKRTKNQNVPDFAKQKILNSKTIRNKHDYDNYIMSDKRGLGTKIHQEILVTDMYDIAGSGAQGTKHLTYAYHNTDTNAKNNFNQNAHTEVLPNRQRFMKAVQEGNTDDMLKYGGRTGSKMVKKMAERLTDRNPLTYLPQKVMGKLAPVLGSTKVGQVMNIAGGVLTASELSRLAGEFFDNDEIEEKFFE